MLYFPIAMNKAMDKAFVKHRWKQQITRYWVTEDAKLIEKTLKLPALEQKQRIEAAGHRAILSYNQTDFVKTASPSRFSSENIHSWHMIFS